MHVVFILADGHTVQSLFETDIELEFCCPIECSIGILQISTKHIDLQYFIWDQNQQGQIQTNHIKSFKISQYICFSDGP